MKGFKSFANKTVIDFGPAFNCVLGPNGSGKSNVLDAICFVLGKASAKGLRADKSANLIYNGGKTKNAAKEGEVSIVFSNENNIFGDFPELSITRIVQASGQSKYRVNGKSSSRQEILDILTKDKIDPDGYNIILQGDINHLIEMSTLERRGIIEQIAGINIYEDKKEKALRELERVNEKLTSADIILAERKTYLHGLKRERNQALKFKELDDKIKRNKATLVAIKRGRKTKELAELDGKAAKVNAELKTIDEKRAKLLAEIDERKKGLEEISNEVERRGEKEQVQLHKDVERLKVDLAVKKQRLETVGGELIKLQDRRDELEASNKEILGKIASIEHGRKDLEKQIAGKEDAIKKVETRLSEFRKKHNMEDAAKIDEEIETIDKEAEKIQESIAKLREEQQSLFREKDKVEIKLEQIDQKLAKVLSVEQESKKELEILKQKKEEFKKAAKELATALTEDSSLAAQLQTARSKLLSRKEELAKLEAQRSAIAERIAGGTAITRIMELQKSGEIKGIHGIVSELGTVNQAYALALEVAAGPRMTSVVVDSDEVASRCIKYLRTNKLGFATFLPLNKLQVQEKANIAKNDKIVGLAVDLIKHDPKFDKVFRYVFGNTLVVTDIDAARALGVGKARMATLQGDLVETSGAMQGGFRSRDRRGVGFQEHETTEKIDGLQNEVGDLEGMLSSLEHKRSNNEELIARLRELKATLEGEIIKTEKSLHLDSDDAGLSKDEKKRLKDALADAEKRLEAAITKVTEETSKLGALRLRKQQLRDKISELRSPALIAEMNTFEEKRQELRKEIAELHGELKTAESEVKNILGPETEKIRDIFKRQEKEQKGFLEEQAMLQGALKKLGKELVEKERAENKFFSQFKELFAKRNKLNDEINAREGDLKVFGEKEREHGNKSVGLSLETARIKAELAGVEEEAKQYEGVEPYPKSEKTEEDILVEVREFERMVQNIGAVNMKALQIYEQVAHEYELLVEKKTKLGAEREDVLLMINEIDAKKRELFLKTFDVVNKNFQHFFERLSRKGEAKLELEDLNDPFNGGMTIKVKFTGKKHLDIRSLSGGEKTMTALAFLFAVQEHEPASFYIMDEVDAALDKHNSEKLAKLIRQYCAKAQYVIISHNDAVISESDSLFGISMDENGMSKVTSLKV